MVRLPAALIVKILKLPWLASMVSEEAPVPVMVSDPAEEVASMGGKADPRVIVLLTPLRKTDESKIISSFAVVALASAMASLKEIKASVESTVSVVVVTV
jgi:hypothetical protein